MIIWGWGKVTRGRKAKILEKKCDYCNELSIWELCVRRTWFTLFFIPIIPYRVEYCIECPNCGSFIKLAKEKYKEIYADVQEHRQLQKENQ